MGILDFLSKQAFGLKNKGPDLDIDIKDGVILRSDCSDKAQTNKDRPNPIKMPEQASEPKPEPKTPKKPEIKKLTEEEQAFLTYLTAGNRAKRTKQEYIYELRWWQRRAIRRGKQLVDFKAKDIESALKPCKPATKARKIAALKTWARWQLRENDALLLLEIEKIIRPPKPKSLPKDLGPERFRELKNLAQDLIAQGQREGIWIGLMLCGGLRISEIKTCKPYLSGVKVLGKGNKERYIPLPDWLLEALKTHKKQLPGGWKASRALIALRLSKIGIRKPHSLRHTYASELVRRGYRIEQIQKLLGHENIQTTTIYAQIDVPDDVVQRLDM